MTKIILLGRCCRVSVDMQKIGLKDKSSMFEWVWTNTLTEINYIINSIVNGEEITITRKNGNDYIDKTNVVTSHYLHTDYKSIFNRRSLRFLDDIKYSTDILFIRDDVLSTITQEELLIFNTIIYKINPTCKYKMLLLSDKDKYNEIICDNVYHRIYDVDKYEKYINECYTTINKTHYSSTDMD